MTITDTWKGLRTCPRCGSPLVRVYRTRKFFCPQCHPEYVSENHDLKEAYREKMARRRTLGERLENRRKGYEAHFEGQETRCPIDCPRLHGNWECDLWPYPLSLKCAKRVQSPHPKGDKPTENK